MFLPLLKATTSGIGSLLKGGLGTGIGRISLGLGAGSIYGGFQDTEDTFENRVQSAALYGLAGGTAGLLTTRKALGLMGKGLGEVSGYSRGVRAGEWAQIGQVTKEVPWDPGLVRITADRAHQTPGLAQRILGPNKGLWDFLRRGRPGSLAERGVVREAFRKNQGDPLINDILRYTLGDPGTTSTPILAHISDPRRARKFIVGPGGATETTVKKLHQPSRLTRGVKGLGSGLPGQAIGAGVGLGALAIMNPVPTMVAGAGIAGYNLSRPTPRTITDMPDLVGDEAMTQQQEARLRLQASTSGLVQSMHRGRHR